MMQNLITEIKNYQPRRPKIHGQVIATRGSLVRTQLQNVSIGEMCLISRDGRSPLPAEVVAFDETGAHIAPFDSVIGISAGSEVIPLGTTPTIIAPPDSQELIVDCLGIPLGDLENPAAQVGSPLSIRQAAPEPLSRPPVRERMFTGIHAIDLCIPVGYGQRLGLFAGPGVGKSTLLQMIARNAYVDRVVIALVGERGREVQEFIEELFVNPNHPPTIVVVATSDESAVRRRCATYTATTLAEHYREKGEDVLLLVDSLTRTARSIRDLGLSAGELPVRQGYTSSVFDELPRLTERAGNSASGSITALYSVLTSFDEKLDILAEEIKSLLDGHIVLDASLAQRGIWPAINIPKSLSRLQSKLLPHHEAKLAMEVRSAFSRLSQEKDLALLSGNPDPRMKFLMGIETDLTDHFLQTGDSKKPHSSLLSEVGALLGI
ncbi:MAG: EscN/YscN/HrcN family type III secretion system ATPase [Bdellovibrionales bacterium]|nr:EscN/YscN/HrcN family type III secretion system ATPase [Bdellovibrionales bacterium]